MEHPSTFAGCREGDQDWYDLFSRGARDWLRHNEKVRKAVRDKLPEVLADADIFGGDRSRTVKVPVKFLEHFRFRLRDPEEITGAGQGDVKPGDQLAQPGQQQGDDGQGEGGNNEGGVQLLLELKVDDIVDWLWEELKLPNLQAKTGATQDDDYKREGWSRRGVRSRLDRRRSLKESIKRRAVDPERPGVHRRGPALSPARDAAPARHAGRGVLRDGRLLQHARPRPAARQDVLLLGGGGPAAPVHAPRAGVRGAHRQGLGIPGERVLPGARLRRHGGVLGLHAGQGHRRRSATTRRATTSTSSTARTGRTSRTTTTPPRARCASSPRSPSFSGYVETPASEERALDTETGGIFKTIAAEGAPAGSYALTTNESVWDAIRAFFREQVADAAEARTDGNHHRNLRHTSSRSWPAPRASTTTPCSSRKCPTAS